MPTFLNGDTSTSGHLEDRKPRKSFADIPQVWDYPDFLDVQLKTFHDFVQDDVPPADRENVGLQAVFNEHFPIKDNRDRYTLEFGITSSTPRSTRCRSASRRDSPIRSP